MGEVLKRKVEDDKIVAAKKAEQAAETAAEENPAT